MATIAASNSKTCIYLWILWCVCVFFRLALFLFHSILYHYYVKLFMWLNLRRFPCYWITIVLFIQMINPKPDYQFTRMNRIYGFLVWNQQIISLSITNFNYLTQIYVIIIYDYHFFSHCILLNKYKINLTHYYPLG